MSNTREPKAETRKFSGNLYRFHSAKYFNTYPDSFYKNFIETRRKFVTQERFAGKNSHCGFFFAGSEAVAIAEMLFYSGVDDSRDLTKASPNDVFARDKSRLFLTVDVTVDNLIDFTDWATVEEFLRFGRLRWKGPTPQYQVQLFAALISANAGGSELTDILGIDVMSGGYKGIIFPSVRALLFEGSPPGIMVRLKLESIQHLSSAGDTMALHWYAVEQMKREFNIVIFSGVELTRSIHSTSWKDSTGKTGIVENPYYGATAEKIELARLRERAHRGIDPDTAAEEGLLTEIEMENEFESEMLVVHNTKLM
jgi:hypothetical protein